MQNKVKKPLKFTFEKAGANSFNFTLKGVKKLEKTSFLNLFFEGKKIAAKNISKKNKS